MRNRLLFFLSPLILLVNCDAPKLSESRKESSKTKLVSVEKLEEPERRQKTENVIVTKEDSSSNSNASDESSDVTSVEEDKTPNLPKSRNSTEGKDIPRNSISKTPLLIEYPFKRELKSRDERVLKVEVLGKKSGFLLVRRDVDGRQFTVPIKDLSKLDQDFLKNLRESSDKEIENLKTTLAAAVRKQRSKSRSYRWHSNDTSAINEAARDDLVVFLLFTGRPWHPSSQSLEIKIFNNQKFQDFAKENLALAAIEFPRSGLGPNKDVKKKYNVKSFPTVVILDSKGKQISKIVGYGGYDIDKYMKGLRAKVPSK